MKKYQLVIYGLVAFPLIGGTVEKGDDTKTGIGVGKMVIKAFRNAKLSLP